MRVKYYGRAESLSGDAIASATVDVYLSGTTTPANIYSSVESKTAVNTTTTDEYGYYTFYVSLFDYDQNQSFDLVLTKFNTPTTHKFYNIHSDTIVLGTYNITSNTSVLGHIYIPKGVIFNVSNGITLSFSVMPEIGLYTVFTGGGRVVFPNGCRVYIDWWGDDLAAAVSNIGTDDATVVISNTVVVAENISIPSNICLMFEHPGKLDVESGYTVTINSMACTTLYKIFTGYGTIAFGAGTIKEVYPEWWGDNTTPGTTDMTMPLQRSLTTGKTVKLSRTKYAFTNLDIGSNERIVGEGWGCIGQATFGNEEWDSLTYCNGTMLICTSTALNAITFGTAANNWGAQLKDVLLVGPGSGTTIGINASISGGATYTMQNEYKFLDNVGVVNFYIGILFDNFITGSCYDVIVRGCNTGINFGHTTLCTDMKMYNVEVQSCVIGMDLEAMDMLNIYGGLVQNNTTGIRFNPRYDEAICGILLSGIWFKANTASWNVASSNALTQIYFDNCREDTPWTWTLSVDSDISILTIINCQFAAITIDFSSLVEGGSVSGCHITTTQLNNIFGRSADYLSSFSGNSNILFDSSLNVGFYGACSYIINGSGAPAGGVWIKGDKVNNDSPNPGGYAGWICTTSGVPGTWKGFGLIAL